MELTRISNLSPDKKIGIDDQEHLFRGIQKSEWNNLFSFIQAKRLRIENLREAEMGPRGGGGAIDMGDDIDTGALLALRQLFVNKAGFRSTPSQVSGAK